MASKTYTTIIKPIFDPASVNKMKAQMEKVQGFGSAVKNTAAFAAGASIIGLWFTKLDNSLQSINSEMDDFMAKTDRISTLAGDLPNIRPEELMLLGGAMEISGIDASMQDKIIKGKDQSIADIIFAMQTEWQKGDSNRKSEIEELLGLKGKAGSELLQGNIFESIDAVILELAKSLTGRELGLEESKKLVGQKLGFGIQKGGDLEEQQARLRVNNELVKTIGVSEKINPEMVNTQAKIQAERDKEIIALFGSYKNMNEMQLAKERTIFLLVTLIDNLLAPLVKQLGSIKDVGTLTITDILIEVFKAVLVGIKDVLKNLIVSILDAVLPNWLNPNSEKSKQRTVQKIQQDYSRPGR
jgi:hypothetical protein